MLIEFPFVWKFLRRAEGQSFLPFPFAFEFFLRTKLPIWLWRKSNFLLSKIMLRHDVVKESMKVKFENEKKESVQ